jgi:GABA(A) receptor-associated protein
MISRDEPLYGLSSVVESMTESSMVKSIVKYVAPEKTFREKYPFEDRYLEASRIMEKYPDRIPVICEHGQQGNNQLPHDPKKKFLIPRDMSIGQFVYVIRKRIKLSPEQAIFLFIVTQNKDGSLNSTLAPTSHMFDTVYGRYKDRDRFLYVCCQSENVFGN